MTGEQFITDVGQSAINEAYYPLAINMEATGMAQVCYANSVSFIPVRMCADTAEHSRAENYEANCSRVSLIAQEIVALLQEMSAVEFSVD